MMKRENIHVVKSYLPPLDEYVSYLESVWESGHLTNQGSLVHELEDSLKEYLEIDHLQFVGNGTIALQLAIEAFNFKPGEIITTPFSYVATTSAILWQKFTPVFVDIEPQTFCIDPAKIEAAITPNTRAIMPVHVFGNPCDVLAIDKIAKKYNLKVIYDAAHAFGVEYKNKSILSYGDISTLSFHATKLFHTIEGGAIVSNDQGLSEIIELSMRFGHNGDEHIRLGINAKSSEFNAAMGLSNLKHIEKNIEKRKERVERYDTQLRKDFRVIYDNPDVKRNYSYYPILARSEEQIKSIIDKLAVRSIFPRRYFYPSLNQLSYLSVHQPCPISESIASRILCLPLYESLDLAVIDEITGVINE